MDFAVVWIFFSAFLWDNFILLQWHSSADAMKMFGKNVINSHINILRWYYTHLIVKVLSNARHIGWHFDHLKKNQNDLKNFKKVFSKEN